MGHNKSRNAGKKSNRRKVSKGRGFAGLEYLEQKRVLATFTVTNLADGVVGAPGDLPGSLRQAVYDSNALAGADEIVFTLGDGGNFLPLTEGQLEIRDSLTITGPGQFDLTISGGRADRIFDVNDSLYMSTSEVTISDMTLTSGSAFDGGAIRATETLVLRDVIVTGNSADSSGGAISVGAEVPLAGAMLIGGAPPVELTIVKSSISGNRASSGGGISVVGYGVNVTISDSQVTGNYATGDGGGGGLFVVNNSGTTAISNSLFAANSALERGGGIALYTTGLGFNYLDNLVVSANSAGEEGGGLSVTNINGATTIISNTRVTGNVGSSGGGVYSGNGVNFAGGGRTEIYQSSVTNNEATNGGGIAAANAEGGQLEIVRSTVSGNFADNDGGGLNVSSRRYGEYYYYYRPYEYFYIPYDPETGTGGYGYGIGPYGPYFGYIAGTPGKTTIRQSTISSNVADNQGGGIHSSGFSFGSATYGYGYYNETLEIENTTVSGNSSNSSGGLYFQTDDYQGNVVDIRHSTFTGNVASDTGGISSPIGGFPYAYANITDSIIAENSGAYYDDLDASAFVTYSLIGSNDVLLDGVDGNIVGTSAIPIDPLLGPLAMNRGPTRTHALLPGSPAINAANPVPIEPPDFDQRGIPRLLDGQSDMGAYELIAGVASTAANGDLIIDGTEVADRFVVSPGPSAGQVEVLLYGQSAGVFNLAASDRIIMNLLDGDDFARIDESILNASIVRGGAGFDELVGGGGPDKLIGSGQSDILRGRSGDDELLGGGGMDDLAGGSGEDTLIGGLGEDTLNGGSEDDRLEGNEDNDTLVGGAGDDVLLGGDGIDNLAGNAGDDRLNGGPGDDRLEGNGDNDTLVGANGSDILLGGGGVDDLSGGSGDDFLDGGAGSDTIDGGGNDDILLGGSGVDTLVGGADSDILIGGAGLDTLAGSLGEDILIGGTTSHDADMAALQAILAEWSNLGLTYLDRIDNIRSGVPGFALVAGSTVFSDGPADSLTGNGGLDWFFNVSTEDVLNGVGGGEVVDATLPAATGLDGSTGWNNEVDLNGPRVRSTTRTIVSAFPIQVFGLDDQDDEDILM